MIISVLKVILHNNWHNKAVMVTKFTLQIPFKNMCWRNGPCISSQHDEHLLRCLVRLLRLVSIREGDIPQLFSGVKENIKLKMLCEYGPGSSTLGPAHLTPFNAPKGITWTTIPQDASMKTALASTLHIPSRSIRSVFAPNHHRLFRPDPIPEPAIPSPHPSQDLQEDISLSASTYPTASLQSQSPVYLNEYDPEHPALFQTTNPEGLPLLYHPIGLDNFLGPKDLLSDVLCESELEDLNNNVVKQPLDFTALLLDPYELSLP